MRGTRVARRYARALLELAERAQAEQWGDELNRLARIVSAPELMLRLSSPQLSQSARQEAMAKIAERLELSYPLRSFAVVVARHGRIRELLSISDAYQDLVDDLLGRTRASITFAVEPSDADVARIVAALESIAKKQVVATVRTDPSLLGGAVAELEGRTYDGSLTARLAEAQRLLAG